MKHLLKGPFGVRFHAFKWWVTDDFGCAPNTGFRICVFEDIEDPESWAKELAKRLNKYPIDLDELAKTLKEVEG